MALAVVRHSQLDLVVDPLRRSLRGTVVHTVERDAGDAAAPVRLNFRGGAVLSASVQGAAATYTLADPWAVAAQRAPPAAGLEAHAAAVHAAVSAASDGELCIDVPPGVQPSADGLLAVAVAFTVSGPSGALVFARDGSGQPYAFTALRPSSCDPWRGAGAGPRCVFPCADSLASRATYDVRLAVAGADADNAVDVDAADATPAAGAAAAAAAAGPASPSSAGGDAAPPRRRLQLQAVCSGDFLGALPQSAPAVAGPVAHYRISIPVPPSAVGWVVGPLHRFERIDSGPAAANTSWMSQLGISSSSSSAAAAAAAAAASEPHALSTGAGGSSAAAPPGGTVGPLASPTGAADASGSASSAAAAAAAPSANTATYFFSAAKRDGPACTHHARRGRRMVSWMSEWLEAPYPLSAAAAAAGGGAGGAAAGNHRHVYLPESVLPCAAALQAAPTGGVALPSALGGNAPGSPFAVSTAVAGPDVVPMLGLTLYPDTLLTPLGVVDAEATTHRAQAAGVAAAWFGCVLGPAAWEDGWLVSAGLGGYLVAQYMRSLRGDGEYALELRRASEAVARLEERFPGLAPLAPRSGGLPVGHSPLAALSPQYDAYVASKAAAVVHMLAVRVGEPAMQRALRMVVRTGMRLQAALAEVAAATKVPYAELVPAVADLRTRYAAGNSAAALQLPPPAAAPLSSFHSPTTATSTAAAVGTASSAGARRPRQDSFAAEIATAMAGADAGASGSGAGSSSIAGLLSPVGVHVLGGGGSGGASVGASSSSAAAAAGAQKLTRARVVALTLVHMERAGGCLSTDAWLAVVQAACPRLPLPPAPAPDTAAGAALAALSGGGGQAALQFQPLPPPPLLLCRPVEEFSEQWLRDTGVPQLAVGVHVSRKRGVAELVVEQIVRPGGRVFTGELTVHIAERAEGDEHGHVGGGGTAATIPPPYAATPDVWSYSFTLSSARDVFYPPLHGKVKRGVLKAAAAAAESVGAVDAAAALMPDTHRKKARGETGKGGGRMDPLAQLEALARRGGNQVDGDEVNDTPVLWVRVDPEGGWLKRAALAMPPVMAATQLVRDDSPGGRLDALACLAGLHAPAGVYHPGASCDVDVHDHHAVPRLSDGAPLPWSVPGRDAELTSKALRRDVNPSIVHTGYLLRPRRRLYVPCRLLAVALDVDPTHAGSGRADRDGLAAALGALRGAAAVAAAAGGSKAAAAAAAAAAAVAARVGAPVGFNFRVRCAAAHALGQWAASRLPPALPPLPPAPAEGADAAAAPPPPAVVEPEPQEGYGGLAAVLLLAKAVLGYPAPAVDTLPHGFSLADEGTWHVLDAPATALPALEAYAAAGTPQPVPVTSLADFELRIAALAALAGVRHADGATPLPVLTLLTRLLRSHEGAGAGGSATVLDDSAVLATLLLGLGQAVVDALPPHLLPAAGAPAAAPFAQAVARRRAAMADAHAALREVLAFQLAALRAQPAASARSGPNGGAGGAGGIAAAGVPSQLSGTVAAACMTALATLEACRCGPPATLPLLRNFAGRAHPVTRAALPPRVRLAAFAGLARAHLAQPPVAAADDSGTGAPGAAATVARYFSAAASLSQLVFGGPPPASAADAAVRHQMACLLHLLHHRTDTDDLDDPSAGLPPDDDDNGAAAAAAGMDVDGGDDAAPPPTLSVSAARVPSQDPLLLQRVAEQLSHAFLPSGETNGDDDADGSGAGAGAPPAKRARRVPAAVGHWRADDVLVDTGALDVTPDPSERLQTRERRLYGAIRAAPSSLGCLRYLADGALAQPHTDPTVRQAARAVAEGVLSSLAATLATPPLASASAVSPLLFHLAHGVWGLAPPAPLRDGPTSVPAAVAHASAPLAPLVAAQAYGRREYLRWRRDALRERHVGVVTMLWRAAEIREATEFMVAGEDGGGGDGSDDDQQQQQAAAVEEIAPDAGGAGADAAAAAAAAAGFVELDAGGEGAPAPAQGRRPTVSFTVGSGGGRGAGAGGDEMEEL